MTLYLPTQTNNQNEGLLSILAPLTLILIFISILRLSNIDAFIS